MCVYACSYDFCRIFQLGVYDVRLSVDVTRSERYKNFKRAKLDGLIFPLFDHTVLSVLFKTRAVICIVKKNEQKKISSNDFAENFLLCVYTAKDYFSFILLFCLSFLTSHLECFFFVQAPFFLVQCLIFWNNALIHVSIENGPSMKSTISIFLNERLYSTQG